MTTVALRQEVLRLEEELKMRQWHEHQLAIADGCGFVCLPMYAAASYSIQAASKLEKTLRVGM